MNIVFRAAVLCVLWGHLALVPFVNAQEFDAGVVGGTSSTDAVIVVTGSHIVSRPELAGSNPVVTLDASAIDASGQTNLTEFLSDTPALLGSTRNINVAGSYLSSGQMVGVNFLNLRNLGSTRTLVLVDGKRHVGGFPGSSAVDINSVPISLVERVDILTGGVSAIYGADGVSGVVNFRLKRNFDGLSLRVQNGLSQRGDAGERLLSATLGQNFSDGRGNIAVAYEFNQADRFRQSSRLKYGLTGPSYTFERNNADGAPGEEADDPHVPDRILLTDLRWADSSADGAVDLDWDFSPDYTGSGKPYNLGEYVKGTGLTIGGDSTPRESYFGDFTPYTAHHTINMIASYEASSKFNLKAEIKYSRSKAQTKGQPTFDFFTLLHPDNSYLLDKFDAAGIKTEGALVTRDNFDFGVEKHKLDRQLWRIVVGADGTLSSHLRYDTSFIFGQSVQKSTSYNQRITDRYYAALDAVRDANGNITCRINLPGQSLIKAYDIIGTLLFHQSDAFKYNGPPTTFALGDCVPLNILGKGAPSQTALNFILADDSDYARIGQYVGTFTLAGDTGAFFQLPGGPAGFAVGAEYRKETSYFEPSRLTQDGVFLDFPFSQIARGGFDVKEVFAEIGLPLLVDVPFARQLSMGGALRLSDYSTIGSATTWNINSNWAPVRGMSFRGTFSSSVRAPNIAELYEPKNGVTEFITDPCGVDRIAEGASYREANCLAAISALGIALDDFDPASSFFSPQNTSLMGGRRGNPNLSAETAKTWTAGAVLMPDFIPNLRVELDWYNIKLAKAITYASAQEIVDLCYDQPNLINQYCFLIGRDSYTGFLSSFSIVPANVAEYQTAGLDAHLSYDVRLPNRLGLLKLKVVGNYLDKLSFVAMPGASSENKMDSRSYPAPRYSGTFDLTWIKGRLSFNYGINWWSKTRRVTRAQEAANPDYLPSKYIWHGQKWEHELNVSIDAADNLTLYGGVNNLFDRKPDVGAVAYPISAVGRYFYVGLKAKAF